MKEFEVIADLNSEVEAQLIDSILNEENIPHLIKSNFDSAYDGIFQLQNGWGYIYSHVKYKERILKILRDFRRKSEDNKDTGKKNLTESQY